MLETLTDVQEGRRSFSKGPVLVSRLDHPRRSFFVLDGHHRIVEAFLSGKTQVEIEIDRYIPRIERTGGAYAEYARSKINIHDWLEQRFR